MKNTFFIAIFFTASVSLAQTVKVTKENIQLKGEAAEGFEFQSDGSLDDLQDQFYKYLKPVGKIKKAQEADMISLPLVNGKNYTSPLYVVVRDKGKGAAWLGIRPSEWPSYKDDVSRDIEKLVYDFGVNYYKDKIQGQIDESNRALQAVERQQQRLLNQNKEFLTRVSDNKNEKIQLEKSLEDNKLQLEALTKKLEQNKKDQDSVAIAGEQIKKVIEMHKEKQRKVN